MNSRLGPVSDDPREAAFSGGAEPRLEPRLIGAVEPAQPRMSAMLKGGGSAPEESRVNSRLGPVSELTRAHIRRRRSDLHSSCPDCSYSGSSPVHPGIAMSG